MFHLLLEITGWSAYKKEHMSPKLPFNNSWKSVGSLMSVVYFSLFKPIHKSAHYGHTHWIIRLNVPSLAWDHVQIFTGWSAYKKEHMSPKLPFNNSWKLVGSLRFREYLSFLLFPFKLVFSFGILQSVQTCTGSTLNSLASTQMLASASSMDTSSTLS